MKSENLQFQIRLKDINFGFHQQNILQFCRLQQHCNEDTKEKTKKNMLTFWPQGEANGIPIDFFSFSFSETNKVKIIKLPDFASSKVNNCKQEICVENAKVFW
jgi:hypothetical protein